MTSRVPSFSVVYQHDGFDPNVFMTFRRDEKLAAFHCLRHLAAAWPNTTYRLKRERKTIARIERGELHYPRGRAIRRFREQFRQQLAALEQVTGPLPDREVIAREISSEVQP